MYIILKIQTSAIPVIDLPCLKYGATLYSFKGCLLNCWHKVQSMIRRLIGAVLSESKLFALASYPVRAVTC